MTAPTITDEALKRLIVAKGRAWAEAVEAERRTKIELELIVAKAEGRLVDREIAELAGVSKGRVSHLRSSGRYWLRRAAGKSHAELKAEDHDAAMARHEAIIAKSKALGPSHL